MDRVTRWGRRTPRRAAAGLGLSALGIVAWSLYTRTPPDELWWPAPAAVLAPHVLALAVAAGGRPHPRLLMLCATVAGLLALLLLLAVGFGLWQLPAAGALLATALAERDRTDATGPAL